MDRYFRIYKGRFTPTFPHTPISVQAARAPPPPPHTQTPRPSTREAEPKQQHHHLQLSLTSNVFDGWTASERWKLLLSITTNLLPIPLPPLSTTTLHTTPSSSSLLRIPSAPLLLFPSWTARFFSDRRGPEPSVPIRLVRFVYRFL